MIRLERVEAGDDVRVLDSAQTYAILQDADEPEPDGTYSIITDSGSDGIQIAGTARTLHGWLSRAREQLSWRTGGPRIMNVLDLSTHHLPEPICAELGSYDGVIAHDTRHGWLLNVPGDLPEHRVNHAASVPEPLWRLWEYAHQVSAEYILLDADADQVDALPSWTW